MSDDLHRERARCVVALARAAQALGCRIGIGTDPSAPQWPVLYVDLPTGQVSWHLSAADRQALAEDLPEYPGDWDGHTTEKKYERLSLWRP